MVSFKIIYDLRFIHGIDRTQIHIAKVAIIVLFEINIIKTSVSRLLYFFSGVFNNQAIKLWGFFG